ncbi:MAG: ABC transporter substrate binding protein [Myxococcota bacterium]|nr:ABC transporter substrate binding protein [Myxococcota bacterium]
MTAKLSLHVVGLFLALTPEALGGSRIAILQSEDLPVYDSPIASFQSHVEASSIIYDLRGERDRSHAIARRLQMDRPEVVLALGAKAAYTAVTELPGTPVVFAMVFDPARYGIEGAYVTGVTMDVPPSMVLEQVALFLPQVNHIGLLVSQGHQSDQVANIVTEANAHGIKVTARRISHPRDVPRAFAAMRNEVNALWLLPDPVLLTPRNFQHLRGETTRLNMPLLVHSEALVQAGALMCVAPDYDLVGSQAADLVQRVLNGENVGTIEPIAPAAPRVVLNRATMNAIDLEVDAVLLDFVDEVVVPREAR